MKAQFETLKEKREMNKISNYFMEKRARQWEGRFDQMTKL